MLERVWGSGTPAFGKGVGLSTTPGEKHLILNIKIKNAFSLGLCYSTFGNLSHGYSTHVLSEICMGLLIY